MSTVEQNTDQTETQTAPSKSIVPSKYSGKYRTDKTELAKFIDTQTKGEDGKLSTDNLFALARANGIAEDKLTRYIDSVASGAHGAAGRSRMSIGNMLRSVAKKEGNLSDLQGQAHPLVIDEAPVPTEAEVDAVDPEGDNGDEAVEARGDY